MVLSMHFAMPFRIRHAARCWSPGRLSRVILLIFNKATAVFAQPTLKATPPIACLAFPPIPNQNDNASPKLVLKSEDCLLHILHLLIEVSRDIFLKKPAHPPNPCKTMRTIALLWVHT